LAFRVGFDGEELVVDRQVRHTFDEPHDGVRLKVLDGAAGLDRDDRRVDVAIDRAARMPQMT